MIAKGALTDDPPWVIGVGASGDAGLRDIRALLQALPHELPAVVMVVLHRGADRPSQLREVLSHVSSIPVEIVRQGAPLKAGVCYIGEPAEHLTFAFPDRADLVRDGLYRNRTIDLLFRSLAHSAGQRTIGVVLSGSLDDGSRGLAAIREAGGVAMVVLPRSLGGGDMPSNAIALDGRIDFIGPPAEIAAEIVRRVCRPEVGGHAAPAPARPL